MRRTLRAGNQTHAKLHFVVSSSSLADFLSAWASTYERVPTIHCRPLAPQNQWQRSGFQGLDEIGTLCVPSCATPGETPWPMVAGSGSLKKEAIASPTVIKGLKFGKSNIRRKAAAFRALQIMTISRIRTLKVTLQ